ncbi:MAG: NADPH-dependent FMN reductase [Mycobacteriales bacterium]
MTVRVLGIGGSLRRGSLSAAAVTVALKGAAEAGADTEMLRLSDLDLPLFNPDRPQRDAPGVGALLAAVRAADGLVVGTPVYGGTLSGAVKNMLDLVHLLKEETPPVLTGKVVGLVAASGLPEGRSATVSMETACRNLAAWVEPQHVVLSEDAFDASGEVYDQFARGELLALGFKLAATASARRDGRAEMVG